MVSTGLLHHRFPILIHLPHRYSMPPALSPGIISQQPTADDFVCFIDGILDTKISVLVMDNVSTHKAARLRSMIKQTEVRCLTYTGFGRSQHLDLIQSKVL